MDGFYMNGFYWRVKHVPPYSSALIDRTGTLTVATTDPKTGYVYLSEDLTGSFKIRVLIHELGHCALLSYGLLDDIHSSVPPELWIDAEEWVCNFIADYGMYIFMSAYSVLGNDAIRSVPYELDRLIA